MTTRRRFTADFKAKVALEALRGLEIRRVRRTEQWRSIKLSEKGGLAQISFPSPPQPGPARAETKGAAKE